MPALVLLIFLPTILLSVVPYRIKFGLFYDFYIHAKLINTYIILLHHSDNEKITHKADLVIGCDGSYSLVRQEMLKRCRLDFSQSYIPHGYVEISMPGRTLPVSTLVLCWLSST